MPIVDNSIPLLIINYSTGRNNNVRAYDSRVNLTGTINASLGIKKLFLEAKSDHVDIHQ